MAWIASHQGIERHPKTLALSSAMGWSIDETIGKLHRFWWWCVDYCESGDLRKHNDTTLGAAVGLNGDTAKAFVQAMVEARWLDRDPYFRVHDWWDYFGACLRAKYKKPELAHKWKAIRVLYDDGYEGGYGNGSSNPIETHQHTYQHTGGNRDVSDGEAKSYARAWVSAECPSFLKQSCLASFERLITAVGKAEAVKLVQAAIAKGDVSNPFAYAEKVSDAHRAGAAVKAAGQPKRVDKAKVYNV